MGLGEGNYYNENNAYAAQVLRNLIRGGAYPSWFCRRTEYRRCLAKRPSRVHPMPLVCRYRYLVPCLASSRMAG